MMRAVRDPRKDLRAKRSDEATIPLIAGNVKPLFAVKAGIKRNVPQRRLL
jgi:hypothetical protein